MNLIVFVVIDLISGVGSVLIVMGLYGVLWGKNQEMKPSKGMIEEEEEVDFGGIISQVDHHHDIELQQQQQQLSSNSNPSNTDTSNTTNTTTVIQQEWLKTKKDPFFILELFQD